MDCSPHERLYRADEKNDNAEGISMLRKRHGRLAAIAAMTMLAWTSAQADEPEFRLLRLAEELAQAEDLAQNQIQLTQFQDSDDFFGMGEDVGQQGTQPVDVESLGGLEAFDFGGFSFETLGNPSFSTDDSALVENSSFIDRVEEVQGTSEVSLTEAPAVDIVTASTFNLAATPDVGETLSSTAATQTVRARRRSPIGFDPRIRGFYTGQIYAMHDGAYQFPVRSDLDGVFSKIDQALIGNVQVFSGPYTVRYGSGFAFLNVDTIPTPRYDCGWENHLRVGTNVRTNGGQTYNTATLYGGGESVGYFANMGYRKGSDYEAGDGQLIPSSYDAFNLFSGIGFDIDSNTRSELRYTHIDQGNTEYAGQFFDVDDLKSDGITHSIIHRDERQGFGYRIDSWANHTEFNGDTSNQSKRKPDFPVLQRVDDALVTSLTPTPTPPNQTPPANEGQLIMDVINNNNAAQFAGTVDGSLTSAGFRAGMTQEIDRETTFGMGTDFRYVRQKIAEQIILSDFQIYDNSTGSIVPLTDAFTGLPDAQVFEPGFYMEYAFAPKQFVETAVGARIGFAATEADPDALNSPTNFIDEDLDVSDVLTSFFITNNLDLAPNWTARVGGGYAERVPTLEQRYADGVFLAIIQSGFSRVIGDPTLSKERNWQVDAQINFDSDYLRSRFSGFHSWVIDYITYEINNVSSPTGARLLRTINTDYATLTGFEYYCEADLTDGWQAFGSLAYLDGRDREINAPLPGINPLEGRVGLRWLDSTPQNRWGLEWGLRMVDNQDRRGTVHSVSPVTTPIVLEEATPGFTTSYMRAYFQPSSNVNVTMGVENLFDNNYFEHLNLRFPPDPAYPQTAVLSPGITPYLGVEIDY